MTGRLRQLPPERNFGGDSQAAGADKRQKQATCKVALLLRVSLQVGEVEELQGRLVGGFQHDGGCLAGIESFLPPRGAKAPGLPTSE